MPIRVNLTRNRTSARDCKSLTGEQHPISTLFLAKVDTSDGMPCPYLLSEEAIAQLNQALYIALDLSGQDDEIYSWIVD